VYSLDEALGRAERAPPGTSLPYRTITPQLWCIDDPSSSRYNQLVDSAAQPARSAEAMWRDDDLYDWVLVPGYNRSRAQAGAGSCIFLHVWAGPGLPMVGCTAFDAAAMKALIRWLDPARRPLLLQLPMVAYRQLAADAGLPPLDLTRPAVGRR